MKLNTVAEGASTNCTVRIQNWGSVTAEDVEFAFSNVDFSVSNVTSRNGGTLYDDGVGPWDIPVYGSLYVKFTFTRDIGDARAPRYPEVCAWGSNMVETCSTGGIN